MGLAISKLSGKCEARKHALAQVSRLLSSHEALDAFCKDLFDKVSEGATIPPAGLQALTKLVVDGCHARDPAMLQQLLDVLAPLPCSSLALDEPSQAVSGLTYDGFIWYSRSVLRVIDAELRAEESAIMAERTSSSTSEPMHEPLEHLATESTPCSPATQSQSSTTSHFTGECLNPEEPDAPPADSRRLDSRASSSSYISSYVIQQSAIGRSENQEYPCGYPCGNELIKAKLEDFSSRGMNLSPELNPSTRVLLASDGGLAPVQSSGARAALPTNPTVSTHSLSWTQPISETSESVIASPQTIYLSGRSEPAPFSVPVASKASHAARVPESKTISQIARDTSPMMRAKMASYVASAPESLTTSKVARDTSPIMLSMMASHVASAPEPKTKSPIARDTSPIMRATMASHVFRAPESMTPSQIARDPSPSTQTNMVATMNPATGSPQAASQAPETVFGSSSSVSQSSPSRRGRDVRSISQSARFTMISQSPLRRLSPRPPNAERRTATPATVYQKERGLLKSSSHTTTQSLSVSVPSRMDGGVCAKSAICPPAISRVDAVAHGTSVRKMHPGFPNLHSFTPPTLSTFPSVPSSNAVPKAAACTPLSSRTVSPLRAPSQMLQWTSQAVSTPSQAVSSTSSASALADGKLLGGGARSQSPTRQQLIARQPLRPPCLVPMRSPASLGQRGVATSVSRTNFEDKTGLRERPLTSACLAGDWQPRPQQIPVSVEELNILPSHSGAPSPHRVAEQPREPDLMHHDMSSASSTISLDMTAEAFESALAASSLAT